MLLREVLQQHEIVIAPGAYDAVSAQIIEKAGFPVTYITGLGNEASDIGYPDLGLTTSTEIVRRAWNIVQSARVPVICDADTGFGGALNLCGECPHCCSGVLPRPFFASTRHKRR